jgi:GH35 family endo-1,4-beta-xylanase
MMAKRSQGKRNAACAWRYVGFIAFCCALVGCSNAGSRTEATQTLGVTTEALTNTACGYALSAEVTKVSKKGFQAKLKVSNANGGKLAPATSFSVLVDSGAATLVKLGHGTFQSTENGYLLSTLSDPESDEDRAVDDETADPDVLAGKAYRFHLKFEGTYTKLVANIISTSGVACDQTAPSVQLTTSGDFFTASGQLSLNATATDDTAVAKVVFAQDGVELATVRTAPYTLTVPVTSALNGRHRYTATAYDLTGNYGSQTQRVLIAIGNKFFGTAATTAADYAHLLDHFNQVTPGNAGKWGSIEATRDVMNWTDLDTAYNFAKQNHLPFKMHTLVWGSQQPAWITSLSPDEQLAELEQFMSAVAARYPNIDLIDVVNEPLHAPPPYAAALGGAGITGWDWVITAFEMARAHFPNSELLLNDYSILSTTSATQSYLNIVKLLKDRGLIDGVAEQAHFYERFPELSVLQANLASFQATGLPLYFSELDLNLADDAQQANRMRDLFTTFWSNPSVLGITHWGYLQGNVWQPNIYLIRNDGSLRPALTWIDCYRAGNSDCPVPPYIPPPHTGTDGGITLQAEEYDNAHALQPAGNVVAFASDGSWFQFSKVVFNSKWNALKVSYANGLSSSVSLTFHLDSLDNPPVATVALPPTGSFGTLKTVSVPWAPLSVQHDLYVKFNGGGANVDFVQFQAPPPPQLNIVANGTFETGTSGWFTFNGGTLAASTARAHGGAQSAVVTNRTSNAPVATDLTSVVKAGTNYPFSLWASISSPDGTSKQVNVTQATTCKNPDGTNQPTTFTWIAGPTTLVGDATWSWVQFSGTVAVPNCTLASVVIWAEGAVGSDLYVDDVQVLDSSGAPINLIADGTFENGQGSWFGFNATTVGVDSTLAHSGTMSLKGAGMLANGLLGRDIKALVAPGKKYTASAWVQLNTAAGSGLAKWQTIQNCNADASDSFPGLAFRTVSNGTWTQLTGTIDLSACTTLNKLILFAGADSGDLSLDDVVLTALP